MATLPVNRNRAHFERLAQDYETQITEMGWVGDSIVAKAVKEHAKPEHKSGLLLDLGTGTGRVLLRLQTLKQKFDKVSVVDFAQSMLEIARQKRRAGKAAASYVNCDLSGQEWTGVPTGANVVTAAGVLPYILNKGAFLTRMHASMAPGAIAAITYIPGPTATRPEPANLLSMYPADPHSMELTAKKAGFLIKEATTFVPYTNRPDGRHNLLVLEKN